MTVRRICKRPGVVPFKDNPVRFYIEVSNFSYAKLAKALKLDEHDQAMARLQDAEPEENLRRALAFNLRDRMVAVVKKLGEYTVRGI